MTLVVGVAAFHFPVVAHVALSRRFDARKRTELLWLLHWFQGYADWRRQVFASDHEEGC
jgi:hypothetical protein